MSGEKGTSFAPRGFGLQPRQPHALCSHFDRGLRQLGFEKPVFDPHQRLAGNHRLAFLDQDLGDDAAFQMLYLLLGLLGDDASGSAGHLVDLYDGRPDQCQ